MHLGVIAVAFIVRCVAVIVAVIVEPQESG